jgi:hypothetical protein
MYRSVEMTGEYEKLVDEKFRARDLALTVAIQSLDKRLDSMNAFREALHDQTNTFLPRSEYHAAHGSLVHVIDGMRIELSRYAVRVEEFDRAASVERAQLDKRLDSMDEFRAQTKDQAATFVVRGEYLVAHKSVQQVADQTRVDLSRCAVRVDEFDRAGLVERGKLDKRLDAMDEFRTQSKDQAAQFATRTELAGRSSAMMDDIKKLEASTATMVRKEDQDKADTRTVTIENKLANWEGRLWALSAGFLMINVFVSWYLSGRLGH